MAVLAGEAELMADEAAQTAEAVAREEAQAAVHAVVVRSAGMRGAHRAEDWVGERGARLG